MQRVNKMQPIIVTDQYPDLYRFLNAMLVEVSACEAQLVESVVIWSPEQRSSLFDESAKLELVERYARKLGVRVVLSAASDPELRKMAQQVGWTVMWDVPGLDQAAKFYNFRYQPYQAETFEECVAC
jgi:hypothetical protein